MRNHKMTIRSRACCCRRQSWVESVSALTVKGEKTMKRQIFRSLLYLSIVAVLACISPRSLFAQAVTGTLLGTVTDPGGAVVPGANVTITEVNTNFTRATVTNESGNYVIGNLDRGVYRIEIEHTGFKKRSEERRVGRGW